MSTLTNSWYKRRVEDGIAVSIKYTRFAHTTVSCQKKLEKKVVLLQLGGHSAKICRLSLHTSNLSEVKIGGAYLDSEKCGGNYIEMTSFPFIHSLGYVGCGNVYRLQ